MEADKVVERSLNALEKGKIVIIPGRLNQMMITLVQLLPRKLYYSLMGKATDKEREAKTTHHNLLHFPPIKQGGKRKNEWMAI